MSDGRLFVIAFLNVAFIAFIASACGSGYWIARFLPVRFNGEKILSGLLIGILAALVTYGSEKLMALTVQPFRILLPLGWFFLQGLSGEVTVQIAARRNTSR